MQRRGVFLCRLIAGLGVTSCVGVLDYFDDSGIFEEKECIQILRTKKFAKNKMTINAK